MECNMKKVLCSAEKSSVIWAEPHGRSSAEQFGRTERSVGHYTIDLFWIISFGQRSGGILLIFLNNDIRFDKSEDFNF